MPDILHELTIDAAPDKVYKAITEQQGLAAWWTPDMVAEAKVGSTVRATFGGGRFIIEMIVDKLESNRKVEWINRQGVPDWIGTHLTWDLSPIENGTRILFGHRDFASADGALAETSYNWAIYLTSLKDYLEKGKGNPDFLSH